MPHCPRALYHNVWADAVFSPAFRDPSRAATPNGAPLIVVGNDLTAYLELDVSATGCVAVPGVSDAVAPVPYTAPPQRLQEQARAKNPGRLLPVVAPALSISRAEDMFLGCCPTTTSGGTAAAAGDRKKAVRTNLARAVRQFQQAVSAVLRRYATGPMGAVPVVKDAKAEGTTTAAATAVASGMVTGPSHAEFSRAVGDIAISSLRDTRPIVARVSAVKIVVESPELL
jgi:hypothetical protein